MVLTVKDESGQRVPVQGKVRAVGQFSSKQDA